MQAFALLVVALVGVWISARQMVIANDKLQMDKFDRLYGKRVAVYEATRKILAQVYEGGVSEDDLRVYGLCALDAQFLFDDAMYKYLRELRQRIASIAFADENIAKAAPPEQAEYKRIRAENFDWLREQGDEYSGFAVRFRPFLVHNFPRRPLWLRWPE